MQIVIKIDDRAWMDEKSIREVAFEYEKGCGFDRAIREGLRQAIVLPKGHGRIGDIDELMDIIGLEDNEENRENNLAELITLEDIDRLNVLIEADEEG